LTNRKYEDEGKPEKALEIYETLLARDDLTPVERRLANFNLGVIYHRQNDAPNGLKYWAEAASPVSQSDPFVMAEENGLAAAANMNLGAHFVLTKDIEKGLRYLEKAVELDPEDGEIRFNLAATLAAQGRFEDAIREFQEAAERGVEIAKEVIKKIEAQMAELEKKGNAKE